MFSNPNISLPSCPDEMAYADGPPEDDREDDGDSFKCRYCGQPTDASCQCERCDRKHSEEMGRDFAEMAADVHAARANDLIDAEYALRQLETLGEMPKSAADASRIYRAMDAIRRILGRSDENPAETLPESIEMPLRASGSVESGNGGALELRTWEEEG